MPHRICFAVKANSNLAVLRILRDLGAGADIVSGGELARVLAAGFDPRSRGVQRGGEVGGGAARGGARRGSVTSTSSRARSSSCWRESPTRSAARSRVGIRVNPDVTTETHPYISTGKSGIKFGVPIDQVAVRRRASSPRSRCSSSRRWRCTSAASWWTPRPSGKGSAGCSSWSTGCGRAGVTTLKVLDIGGGLGIRYGDEPSMDPDRFADAVVPMLAPSGLPSTSSRGAFWSAAPAFCSPQVLYRKHSGGKEFVVVDAGMNDLVRPSHYQAYHEIVELEEQGRPAARVDVVGPVCETGRLPGARSRAARASMPGERLAVLGAGAYGFVMASNYNSRPRPAEVVVDGGAWWVARPRETVDELYAEEQLSP